MAYSVVYTRVSTDEQAKTGQSLESQHKACTEFSERSGLDVLEVFREEGASAKSTDRKELLRMLNFCKDNKDKVDAVIVWKVDRFARRAEDHLMLKALLTKLNIRLLSVTENLEDTTSGHLMETILAAFAQHDNEVRTERTITGIRARMEQGGWVTYAPIGYINIKDSLGRPTLNFDEEKAEIIRNVFRSYATGTHTLEGIRNYAYGIGLRMRQKNGKPSLQTMANILRNTSYIARRPNKETGELDKLLHQPLISDELFNEVQGVLNGKSRELRVTKDDDWPLRAGFIKCSDCNTPLTGSSPKGRHKYYPKYSCPQCKSSSTGKSVSVNREIMHNEFKELLVRIRPKKRNLVLFRKVVLLKWNQEYKELTHEKKRIETDLTSLQERRERVLDLFVDDKLTESDKDKQLHKIDAERSVLRIQRGELEKDVDDRELVIDVAIDFMTNVSTYWERAPLQLQRRFQNLVFPDGIAYEFESGFRTAKMGDSYEVIQNLTSKSSSMVGVLGFEPRTNQL